jgi:hypothetical protein
MTETAESSGIELPQRTTQEVKALWVSGFIQGNTLWPQAHEGINIFTTTGILNDLPESWKELNNSLLSRNQFSRVGKSTSDQHRDHDIHVATPDHAQDTDVILQPGALQDLWHDVNHNATTTIARFVDTINPPVEDTIRTEDEDVLLVQSFFDDPTNAPHIDKLRHIFNVAKKELLSPDSKSLSDFYKEILSNKPYDDLLKKYEPKYRETFSDSDRSLAQDPGTGAWELAAHNVQLALVKEFGEEDVAWLGANFDVPL